MKKVINILKQHKKMTLTIIYSFIFILYVIMPVCFDTKIYLGAAYQADLIGSFPINLLEAWEHKLVLNRFFFYFIYKIVKIFVDPNNFLIFEMIVKLIYGLISVLVIKIFTKSTKEFFKEFNISKNIVFASLYLTTMFTDIYFNMQTETTGLLILLISIVLVLKKKTIYKIIAAFLISSLFFLKGVTLLYAVIVLVVMILNKQNKKEIAFTIITSIGFLILELIGLYIIYPKEIIRIYLSSNYITSSWETCNLLQFIFYNMLKSTYLLIGIICLIYNFICYTKTKNIKLLLIEVLTWTLLIIGIYIQKMRYLYQIALIMPACLLSFYISIYYIKNKVVTLKKYVKIIMAYLILVITFIMILICIEESIQIYITTKNNEQIVKELKREIPDLTENEMLYIGNGLSAYYIKTKSYINYTTTIYLSNDNEIYKNSEHVKELKKKIKQYTGKYIIVDDEEMQKKRRISDDIIKFINENYDYLQSSGIMIYESKQPNLECQYSSIYIKK
ncbi:MAG: hypothetical protein GX682_03140 [Clostridiaceae bacterium]|nr:hypothetical protein [Clostridiaceae bacterium]